jgi:HEAT repeat protein
LAHRGFDEQMAALDALKGQPLDAGAQELIRKSFASRSNFLVAKAARLAEDNQLVDLMPEMIAAFERFFANAEKSDPQCWAKNALSRALSKLGCRDKDVFLRGLHHHQMEPVWGGRSDSAGTVRANCAHALMGCEGLIAQDVLLLLLDLLADKDKEVRVEAVRALSQLDELAVPVLRLRAMIPGEEPEVLSVCFSALLAIDRDASIRFVARSLEKGDDAAGEAAFALAETHHPSALEALMAARLQPSNDPWFAGVLMSAIALTRLPNAISFLLGLIESEDRGAEEALEALMKSSPGPELRARIEQAVEETGSTRLKKAYDEGNRE